MWYLDSHPCELLSDNELEEAILRTTNRIIILDGPSGCGKTFFLRRLKDEKRAVRIPIHEIIEKMIKIIKMQEYSTASFSSRLLLDIKEAPIVCFDDVDLSLGAKEAVQTEVASILQKLSSKKKIVLAGICVKERCEHLMILLSNLGVEYYYYKKEK